MWITGKWVVFHLDDPLYRDDISCMSQAYWLIWSQALVALLHHLQYIHIKQQKTKKGQLCLYRIIQFKTDPLLFFFLKKHLSEVTLLNKDGLWEGNHMAALGFIGWEVWYSNLLLNSGETKQWSTAVIKVHLCTHLNYNLLYSIATFQCYLRALFQDN